MNKHVSFQQQETERQVRFKRSRWPELGNGTWRKRQYAHILPECELGKAFYPPLVEDILRYLEDNDIALHTEVLNLKSSQTACLNILFPLRIDLRKATHVLSPILSDVRRVINIEFEYTGPDSATCWLGEPPGGKRGQNRTSIDAAVWWEDEVGRRRLTFIEFKYTERGLGSCGGYKSRGNRDRQTCETVNPKAIAMHPQQHCYVENGKTSRTSRHYWDHLAEARIRPERFGGIAGCPFRGPFYQLMRQYLLAAYCQAKMEGLDEVDVVVLAFRGNESLVEVPDYLRYLSNNIICAWNSVLEGVPPLRLVHVEDLASNIASADREWKKYLGERYGL